MTVSQQDAVRSSGRRHDELRTVLCQRSILNRADGSSKWTQGNSNVIAAVYGPRQAGLRKEDAEKAVIEVIFRPRYGIPGPREAEYEHLIRRTVEAVALLSMHPRTSISIVLQVEQEDGCLLACALNAACAALVDAAVPISCLFAATACAVLPSGEVFMDPDAKEEQEAVAVATFAYTSHCGGPATPEDRPPVEVGQDVLTCSSLGRVQSRDFFKLAELCRVGARHVATFSHSSLQKTFAALQAVR